MKWTNQRGIALITALLIVTLATTAAVTIAAQLQREIRRSGNIIHHDQAYIYALAAEDFARYGLKLDFDAGKIDHLNELWHVVPVAEEIEGGTLEGKLDDLQGLFNLNNLANKKALDQERFQRILKNLEFKPEEIEALTATLLDWMDPDQTGTLIYGAEDDYYQGLAEPQRPYLAANRLLADLSELRLIKGFTPEILTRLRINTAYDEETGEPLAAVFTVLPEHTELNINTAPAEVLKSLAIKITDDIAQQIITRRDGSVAEGGDVTPFESIDDFKKYLQSISITNVNTESLGVSTQYFLLNARATIGHSTMNLYSRIKRDEKGLCQVVSRSQGVY